MVEWRDRIKAVARFWMTGLGLVLPCFGFGANDFKDGIDRDDPNFVTVSRAPLVRASSLARLVGHERASKRLSKRDSKRASKRLSKRDSKRLSKRLSKRDSKRASKLARTGGGVGGEARQ